MPETAECLKQATTRTDQVMTDLTQRLEEFAHDYEHFADSGVSEILKESNAIIVRLTAALVLVEAWIDGGHHWEAGSLSDMATFRCWVHDLAALSGEQP